jgi:hypothetical protein
MRQPVNILTWVHCALATPPIDQPPASLTINLIEYCSKQVDKSRIYYWPGNDQRLIIINWERMVQKGRVSFKILFVRTLFKVFLFLILSRFVMFFFLGNIKKVVGLASELDKFFNVMS